MYPTECPVTKCELKTKGCNQTYAGTNLKMDLVSPFELKGKRNSILGFKEDICVQCTNGQMTVTNNITLTQTSKCLVVLEPSATPLKNQNINHDAADFNPVIAKG